MSETRRQILRELRQEVRRKAATQQGTICPCCDQTAKVYNRKLHATMARGLIWLVKYWETVDDEWIYIPSQGPKWVAHGDFAKLSFWRLIVSKVNDDQAKKDSGFWKPTERGIRFARKEIRIPSHVYLYNNQCQGFSDEKINISQALGKRFNYRELMDEEI
jgi:hypothetical protein